MTNSTRSHYTAMIPIEYLAKPEYAMAVVLYVLVGITNLCVTVRFAIPLIRHGNLQYGIDLLVIVSNVVAMALIILDGLASYNTTKDWTIVISTEDVFAPLCFLCLMLLQHKIRMLFVSLAPIMSPGYNKTFPLFDDNPKAARIVLVLLHFLMCWPFYTVAFGSSLSMFVIMWYNAGAALQALIICIISGTQAYIILIELLKIASSVTNTSMKAKHHQVIAWTSLSILMESFGIAMFILSVAYFEAGTAESTLTGQFANSCIAFEVASESIVMETISSILRMMKKKNHRKSLLSGVSLTVKGCEDSADESSHKGSSNRGPTVLRNVPMETQIGAAGDNSEIKPSE